MARVQTRKRVQEAHETGLDLASKNNKVGISHSQDPNRSSYPNDPLDPSEEVSLAKIPNPLSEHHL
jgi:hypothetical protein